MLSSLKYSLFVLLFLITHYSVAQQAVTSFLTPQNNRGLELGIDFSEQLTDYEVYEMPRRNLKALNLQRADKLILNWSFQGEAVVLELHRVSLFEHDFKIRVGSHAEPTEVSSDHGVHYRGQIVGRPGSLVALSLFENDLVGIVSDEEFGLVNLGVLRQYTTAESLRLIAYQEQSHLTPPTFDCHTPDDPPIGVALPGISKEILNSFCFSSYLECDFALYEEQGSDVDNVISFITGAFNSVAMIYDNEDIGATISEIFVWTEPDGYSANDSEDALDAFTAAMSGGFNGDLAHLISRNPNGLGGLAWVNVICSNNNALKTAYSNINATYNDFPQYSWTVNVLTHEIGHNLGSRHTHACVWNGDNTQIDDCGNVWAESNGDEPDGEDCYDSNNPIVPVNGGTIMSYCHLLAGVGMNFNLGFGTQPGDRIRSILSNCSDCASTDDPPINNDCLNATALSCGETFSGSTEFATDDDQPDVCNGLNLNEASGVWYRYTGDGATVTAALCSSGFDTRLAVLFGDCDELICVQVDDNGCEDGSNATVTFQTIPGQEYYLYLTGTAGASGEYSLTISCEFPIPENDLCIDALPIQCGETIVASTVFASNEDAPADCDTELDAGPGLWYVFAGTGEEVTLTTCGEETDFDTKLGVFQGECGVLNCVIGDDDDSNCNVSDVNTTVTFNTALGENYYVYVTGFNDNDGTFALSAACVSACFPPTGLIAMEQGYAFARLNWAPAVSADNYQLRYRQQGTTSWESMGFTAEFTQLIGNLQPCTTYEIQVQSDCAGVLTDFSESTFLTTDGCDDDYCYAYGDSFGQWITEVSLNNLLNSSDNGYGYTNFNNLTASVEAGQSYELSFSAESDGTPLEVFWSAWIDYNQDAIFSAEEEVATNLSALSDVEVSLTITIPANAASGTTRLRVRMATDPNDDPCANELVLDVEDYGIIIGGIDAELVVTPETISFGAEEGNAEVNVSSNIDWVATTTATWLTISPENGNGDGIIMIDCDLNPSTDNRTTTITVSGEGISRTVTVEQEGTSINCEDSETTLDTTICAGQSVMIGDNTYVESGIYENLFETEEGCDSLIILNLEVLDLSGFLPTEVTTCPGEPVILLVPAGFLLSLPGETPVNSLQLLPGIYTITVEDDMFGCQLERMVTVLEEGLAVSISGDLSLCASTTTTLTASTGATYLWSTGATTADITVNLPGEYCVTVTDENDCQGSTCVTVSADPSTPVFTNCPDNQNLQLAAGQNSIAATWPEVLATDECDPTGVSISSTHQSGDLFLEGSTTVTYTTNNTTGQEGECTFTINVQEIVPNGELTFYLDTLGYTRSGDTLCVPVRVLNFVDVAAFQLSLLADNALLSSLDTVLAVPPLMGLDGVGGLLFDRINSQQAQLIWLNASGEGLTLADSSAILMVKIIVDNPPPGTCIPLAMTDDPLFIEAFVIGEGSTVPNIINGSICLAGEYTVFGKIYRIDDEPINLAEVSLLGNDTTRLDTTDVAGRYDFASVLGGSEYILRPARDFDDAEGLSVLDMITILRHIQGQALIDNPYLLMAADVNQSQSISTADILEIRELIMGNLIAFGNHTSWFFLPVDYSFPNPANPWQEAVPYEAIIPNLDADTIVDFYGLKTGDVNLSNLGQNLTGNTLTLSYADQQYAPGQLLEVAIYANDFADLSGFQLVLNSNELAIVDMKPGAATLAAGSLASRRESWKAGELPLIFLRQQTTDVKVDDPLFTLQLRAKTHGQLSEQLTINHDLFSPEAFSTDLSPLVIELSTKNSTNTETILTSTTATLVRVQPNPFRQYLQLDFQLPQATELHLQLLDVQGKIVHQQSTTANAGAMRLTLEPVNTLSAGIYFCRWQTEQASGVVKVVKE